MYNMTMNEFGQLMNEYDEIEKIKYKALDHKRNGDLDKAQETMKLHTEKRAAFVKKFMPRTDR